MLVKRRSRSGERTEVTRADEGRRLFAVRRSGVDVWIRSEKKGDLAVVSEVVSADCYGLRRGLRTPPRLVLDVGAHVGTFSLVCRSLWPSCRIVCVEPNRRSLEVLRTNLGRDSNVTIVEAAVGHPEREAWLNDHEAATGGGSVVCETWEPGGGYVRLPYPIRVLSVQSVMEEAGVAGQTVDLAKFDCEGGELEVFAFAAESGKLPDFAEIVGEYHCPNGLKEFESLAKRAFSKHDWSFWGNPGPIGYFSAKRRA